MNNSMRERRGGGVKPNEGGTEPVPTRARPRSRDHQSSIGQYALTGALAAAALLTMYLYLSSISINSIFFRYGLPSDSAWEQNDRLTKNVKRVDVKLDGPEAIALGPNGTVYTGLRNGVVVRVDLDDGRVEKIVQIGEEMDERVCDFVRSSHVVERKCGRPFGMRFKPDSSDLYVADSFYGIVKIDVNKKTKQVILSANDTRFGSKPLRSTEDIDIDPTTDTIYFVDSSHKHDLTEAAEDIKQASPGGRLFAYSERSDRLDLLAERLYYPNGVQLAPQRDHLLVNEFSMARIIKFYLSGPKKGQREVFADLPGLSEAIRLTHKDTLLVPFVAVFPIKPSRVNYLGSFSLLKPIIGFFLNPNQVMQMWPKYGLLAEFDMHGRAIRTWHDPTGQVVSHVTNAVLDRTGTRIILGSFTDNYISLVDYDDFKK